VDPRRYQEAKRILLKALELPPEERPRHIKQQAAQHPDLVGLADEVLDLLARQDSVARVVDEGLVDSGSLPDLAQPGVSAEAPDHVGSYQIIGTLGEGGMGVVYHGRQTAPIKRDVAIKILHAGLNTERILERFAWERRSLARMDHPNIARILDAGVHEGRPFVVLELIDGEPITTFCRERRISPLDRPALMEKVCQAVQHAHDRGVLHRDLKPSNILVREVDGQAVPIIIDFGIAKAFSEADAQDERSDLTLPGLAIGTPAYMSPEQFAGQRDLDVRTDVYALGVILYELLADRRPFNDEELARSPAREDPEPPSRVVGQGTTGRDLRGDLDWICLRAIHNDPDRRYRSAAELAEDLGRYRERRPVLARPDSWSYRASRMMRRHPVGAAVAVAALAFMVVGATFLGYHVRRLETERTRALAAEEHARREGAAAEEIATFLEALFVDMDPIEEGQEPTTALGLLDEGAQRLEESLDAQPAERGRLWGVLGRVNQNLARHELAEVQLKRSLAAYAEAADTTASLPARAEVYRMLAICLHDLGRFAASETAFGHAIAAHDRVYEELDIVRVQLVTDQATAIQAQGRTEEALDMLAEGVRLARDLGEPGQEEVAYISNLRGYLLYQRGRYDESLADIQSALAMQRKLLSEDNVDLVASLNNVGGMLLELDRPAEARLYLEESQERLNRIYQGKDHPAVTRSILALGRVALAEGDTATAIANFERSHALYVQQLGQDHHSTWGAILALAAARHCQGRLQEARTLFSEGVERFIQGAGPENFRTLNARQRFGEFLKSTGEVEAARQQFELAVAGYERIGLPGHPRCVEARRELAGLQGKAAGN
jgi:tetratricopeptide (TPR) repeat protein/tRNA A-37 threonylcarbamoyl transferase component Bud32